VLLEMRSVSKEMEEWKKVRNEKRTNDKRERKYGEIKIM
jgi:hypothetical protein